MEPIDPATTKAVLLREYYKRNPLEWMRQCVKTIDEHNPDEPVRPFTIKPYTKPLVDLFVKEQRLMVAKSRQVMASWTFSALALHTAQFYGYRKVFIISKKQEDAFELVKRIRHIYQAQPKWLQTLCPLDRKIKDQPQGYLYLANGSEIRGLPQGADQIRSYTASLILIDEASFLDLLEETYGACAPSVAGGGKLVVFSSAGSSYFGNLVEIKDRADWGTELIKGFYLKKNQQGITTALVHYSADPDKDPGTEAGKKWLETALIDYPGGRNSQKWQKEMECDFTVGVGEPVFEYLASIEPQVKFPPDFITPKFIEECMFYGGLDWGVRNNTAFTVLAEDRQGIFWVVWEWADKKKTPTEVAEAIHSCPFYDKLQWIAADPTMWTENQARKDGYTSFARILHEEIPDNLHLSLMPAHGRSDIAAITKIHAFFKNVPIRLRISELCPTVFRELKNLRFVDTSGDKGPKEMLVDKDNHNWDTVKYILLSHPTASIAEEKITRGTFAHLNTAAEQARAIAVETGEDPQEIFNDIFGQIGS